MSKNNRYLNHERARVAAEAARLMVEQGMRDFGMAKRKAAARLGVSNEAALPRNAEIEQAMAEYQRLFQSDSQPRRLRVLRDTAREAMYFFRDFHPRLTGAVLRGTASDNTAVELHVFCESPEELEAFLSSRDIPFETLTKRYRYPDDEIEECLVYSFIADEIPIEVSVFHTSGRRRAPLCPVDGRPMRRASLAELQALSRD